MNGQTGDVGVSPGDIDVCRGDVADEGSDVATPGGDVLARGGDVAVSGGEFACRQGEVAVSSGDVASQPSDVAIGDREFASPGGDVSLGLLDIAIRSPNAPDDNHEITRRASMTAKKTTKTTNAHAAVHAHNAAVSTGDASVKTAIPTETAPPSPAPAPVTPPAPATLQAKVQEIIEALSTVPVLLGTPASPASPLLIEGRRSQPKMRAGGEAQMPTVLNLADQYKLSIPGASTADARADMQLVATLQPLATSLSATLLLVQDLIAQAQGRAWTTTTSAYVALAKQVKKFPALQEQLAPMASLMATKHKDAPTILRPAEAKTLSKSRAAAKAKKAAKGSDGAASPVVAPPVVAPVQAAPPAAQSPSVAGPTPTPAVAVAPASPANGAQSPAPVANGVPHS